VGYDGESFPPLWDTTEEDFFRCGIQRRTISGWQTNFFLLYPTTQEIFFFRCILHHNRILCSILYPRKKIRIVSHNAAGFLPLYPTMEDISLHCGIQRKRFFFVVGYNGKSFPPLWYTTKEVFFHFGIQRKRFFSVVGYNAKKLYNAE
jgi:hypothetical protein